MRRREGLVQVDMHNIEAHVSRTDHTEHRVHVGAVVVEQAAACMDELRDLADLSFEETESIRVRHHDSGDIVSKQRFQILHVDETVGVRLHFNDLQAAYGCAGRVSAMGAVRYYDPRPLVITAGHMVLADQHKAGQFTVGAGAWEEGEV